jgi:RNA polymerase sigma-70 factor, ECF subfamily
MAEAGPDVEAVARVRSGEAEAFRPLVERHTRAVYRLAYRLTGNQHDAEDVVQEAFLRAFKRLDDFEERSQFGSWLHRIAANCAYDLLRARARDQLRVQPVDDGEDGLEQRVASPLPGPERLAAGQEVRTRLRVAMDHMSTLERTAFTLRHLEGCSIAEIGRALGLDTSAVKQSIFRAVRKVRRTLGEIAPEAAGAKP